MEFNITESLNQGLTIAITGYLIVFLALVLLFYVFNTLSKILLIKNKRRLIKRGKKVASDEELNISGEVTAAIATALYLSLDLHDKESDVLTIKRISRVYSPWNSKIYGMRFFRR